MINQRNPLIRGLAFVGLIVGLTMAVPAVLAQDSGQDEKENKHQPSEKVSDALQKLKPLQDAKNFAGMLDLVDNTLSQVAPTSYDTAYLLDIKARLAIQLNQYPKAIEPWKEALRLSDQFQYFDDKTSLEISKYLAELIFSVANDNKDKVQQQQQIAEAVSYIRRYLNKTPKPESEVLMMYANALYFEATADEKHMNTALLDEALKVIQSGMLAALHPKEGFYRLELAILQQQNDFLRATELIELMLKEYPNKKDMWPILFGMYVNLAGQEKREKERRNWYVRAINTLDRAQALGFMNTPRDNYNLFTLYINAGEFDVGTDLLHSGLRKGTIESTVNNWRLLGAYYQQANKELQAIDALKEATKLFPKDGSLDVLIGQIYQQLDKMKDAHDAYVKAVKKGNLGDKPHHAYLYLAYTALDLGDYDEALKAINVAGDMPDGKKDPQVKTLKEGIEAMIADRERVKAAAEAAAKKL